MDEKLNIVQEEHKDFILLKIEGRIDGYWSKHLDEYLDNMLRTGSYNIALDLSGVYYMSSLGIRILVKYVKLFRQVSGGFGILNASKSVVDLLEMVGLNAVLKWRPSAAIPVVEDSSRTIESNGYVYNVSPLNGNSPMECSLIGDPGKIRGPGYSNEDSKSISFGRNHYGIGLGAIGLNFEDCQSRFGEFVALGDAVVYSPAGKSNSPDYMLKTGTLIPGIELLYGITFEGNFDKVVNFASNDLDQTIKFSHLITELFEISGFDRMVMVMLAETSGLVGLSINNSPAAIQNTKSDPFIFPEIRENVNFTTEPEHKKMMTITVGMAAKKGIEDLENFTRPLSPDSSIQQHFHTAIFSYHPLKKKDIDLDDTITAFFDQDKIRGVLHLINDTRELTGVGESDFKGGVCWIGKINSLTKKL
jgi:anti-anti-sigma factor